ncbi:MAG: c-type cytochrome [Verrucomicrobiales bacterium]|nr:c-type cytochrome [Verrucomicrobiales bacterium]
MQNIVPSSRRLSLNSLGIVAAVLVPAGLQAADPFAEGVRPTDPLTPAAQAKTFHLPPGFTIELVASEPQIAKPMNMAFDARGRLWVTTSYEYPFPKKPGEAARDAIKVFEDTNGDGSYDRVTTFAEGLNIPIGITPYGNGCLAWSIPNIWYFQDTDGDGKSDRQEVVFGPLGWERDTHGNIASFIRGNDGWIYGTHGFNNNSTFKAKDGSSISLNSGNTYRFRPDGSRVEQMTWGQVNPFGMCVDERGYFYTADCHSSPIYQLIPGAHYPSFGKPDDGLGFAPTTVEHSHGSTAISGIVMVEHDGWPAEFAGNLFIGNVMTSRINRDRVEWRGSSPVGHELPDFLSTDDPWFRPVDLKWGPDGALYIADFYNRIIGHYEVPLTHPGRDRERGRIWRVRYTGAGSTPPVAIPNLARLDAPALIKQLGSTLPVLRTLAFNELVDRVGMPAASLAKQVLAQKTASPQERVGALWLLLRLSKLDNEVIRSAGGDSSPLVRIHTLRAIAAQAKPSSVGSDLLMRGLEDSDAHVKRAAAEGLSMHPSVAGIQPTLAALRVTPAADTHLRHALRVTLRNQFRLPGGFEEWKSKAGDAELSRIIADIALAVGSAEAGQFLLHHLQKFPSDAGFQTRALKQAARYTAPDQVPALIDLLKRTFAKDAQQQAELLTAMRQGLAEKGHTKLPAVTEWSTDVAESLLKQFIGADGGWVSVPADPARESASPWIFQERRNRAGVALSLISSLPPGGEALTGSFVSSEFTVPGELKFYVAGHDGFPDQPAKHTNRVILREASTGQVLAETFAPRTDVATPAVWNLSPHQGKRARIEIVDQDNGPSYAWIAAGKFETDLIGWPRLAPRDIGAHLKTVIDLAEGADLARLSAVLQQLAETPSTDLAVASTAVRILTSQSKADGLSLVGMLAADPLLSPHLRRELCTALAQGDSARSADVLLEAFRQTSSRIQTKLAETMAGHPVLAGQLMDWASQSKVNARLLKETAVRSKLSATLPASKDRIEQLTAGLPNADQTVQKLIDDRRNGFNPTQADAVRGAAVYAQACAVCHQLKGVGKLVGPQLDGIGNRGLERLCEDILDPNRNVDQAFRTQLWVMKDGEVLTGLPRREEGDLVVLANAAGQETSYPKKDIQERRDSPNSLMPENLGEAIPPADFNHLLAYLLQQSGPGGGK